MRTTLSIDDDVMTAVKALARQERRTAGEVLSRLAREALTTTGAGEAAEADHYGFHPFSHRGGIVTNELIDRLREEGEGV